MPLPTSPDMAWPPKSLAPVRAKLDEWTAWYSGETDRLARVYQGTDLARPVNRPSQYRGGLVGWVARTFWGEPTLDGEQRAKLHVPLASDIAQTSARLLFSEPPTLTAANKQTQARINELVDDGAHATLLAAAETGAAKGGGYLRIVWDKTVRPRPWIARVDAAAAVPEWRWDVLWAVTFWRILEEDGNRVLRHLERHERGAILHGLYEGTPDRLGRRVDFGAHPDVAWLADVAPTGEIATGLRDRLTARYVPNITPSRIWADLPAAANLGRSDYDGVEPLFDALDETWTSLMRDLRLARARLVVPEEYLTSLGPGNGAYFDTARELFTPIKTMADDSSGLNLELIQPLIRVEDHLRMSAEQARLIVETAGYSAQSFGMAEGAAVTATEVAARERESFISRDAKIMHWRPALQEILETLLMVDAVLFNSGVTPEPPQVDFGDTVSQDPESVARTLQLLEAAAAISTYMKVKTLHPDWEDKEIRTEVDRIRGDAPPVVDVGSSLGALAGNEPPPADEPEQEPPAQE
ncbi:phage capsid protein [Micromonospora sp. NPDC023633]|uniref:phage capsid protein n=1 Tax=Micromonospora sp. NPDC023633 TaxID=3154320 RepID=UPI0033D79756